MASTEGSRLRILQLLQRNASDTVEGLAKTIGLAPATVRRHLDILQRDRLVAFGEVRKKTGRPEYSFYLTEDGQEALPKDYDMLLSLLVQELTELTPNDMEGLNGEQLLELVFRRLSDKVCRSYEQDVSGKDLDYRLRTLMKVLTEQDFFPEAEVVDGTFRISLLNCPFRSVALQNKAVCCFDSSLVSAMLDVEVAQEACIREGDTGCMYVAPVGDRDARLLSGVTSSERAG